MSSHLLTGLDMLLGRAEISAILSGEVACMSGVCGVYGGGTLNVKIKFGF